MRQIGSEIKHHWKWVSEDFILRGLKSRRKMNYSSQFYIVKLVLSKFEVLKS